MVRVRHLGSMLRVRAGLLKKKIVGLKLGLGFRFKVTVRARLLRVIAIKTTQSLKTETRIKRENNIGYIFCKVHVLKWSVVIFRQTYQSKADNLCTICVCDLDGECKFVKHKTL